VHIKNIIPTLGYMVMRDALFYYRYFFMMGILLQRSIDNIKNNLSSLIERERGILSHFSSLFIM
jgi:hypothetical protein